MQQQQKQKQQQPLATSLTDDCPAGLKPKLWKEATAATWATMPKESKLAWNAYFARTPNKDEWNDDAWRLFASKQRVAKRREEQKQVSKPKESNPQPRDEVACGGEDSDEARLAEVATTLQQEKEQLSETLNNTTAKLNDANAKLAKLQERA